MEENYIQLKKNEDILKLRIRDEEGNDTGNYLEFNLEDIELPFKLQTMMDEDKKNREFIKNEFIAIDKKQDHKGIKLFSAKQEAKIKAMQKFYKREIEIYNMFLGENGVEKLLNGRQLSWGTLAEIDEIIEQIIVPKLNITTEKIKKKITDKYGNNSKKDDEVIE